MTSSLYMHALHALKQYRYSGRQLRVCLYNSESSSSMSAITHLLIFHENKKNSVKKRELEMIYRRTIDMLRTIRSQRPQQSSSYDVMRPTKYLSLRLNLHAATASYIAIALPNQLIHRLFTFG